MGGGGVARDVVVADVELLKGGGGRIWRENMGGGGCVE